MSLEIHINLSDEDLGHFIKSMREAQAKASHLTPQQITGSARKLLAEGDGTKLPDFVAQRLARLDTMIDMAEDDGFALPDEDRSRVLGALTYFADPGDIIPDTVPVLGFLDDAIMIELCLREVRYELEAYEDFSDWRNAEATARGVDPKALKLERVEWAEARRVEAIQLMRRRRRRAYTDGTWRPVLFSVS